MTSAVSCWIALNMFGRSSCRVIFIDTHNEDEDTYRFLKDCQEWYEVPIETISSVEYKSIPETWYRYNSLNVAHGAICSYHMKRRVRELFQKDNPFSYQVFGFDIREPNRAKAMTINNPQINPVYPLLFMGLSKTDCVKIIQSSGITIPRVYVLGFNNNNCFNTGCVQGGIGYWQKMGREFPEKFERMAEVEHDLSSRKGFPVTMLMDQSDKKARNKVFLKHNPQFPHVKDISMMRGREPKHLLDCNGFCGIDDLGEKGDISELNLE